MRPSKLRLPDSDRRKLYLAGRFVHGICKQTPELPMQLMQPKPQVKAQLLQAFQKSCAFE